MKDKLFTKGLAETIGEEKLFVASDEVVDRQGESISQEGWNLENFKKNPVIQWAHNPNEPAIATAKKIGFKVIDGKKKLIYQPEFHRKTPMSNYIADLVEAGVIQASSVGFKPLEMEENTYTKAELLEISFVNVPANQNALSLGIAKGYSRDIIKAVMPDVKEEDINDVEDTEEKSVISYHKYPLAEVGVAWDGGAEVKAASVEDLKKMCAWYDADNSDVKSSYKLPHHAKEGYKTILRGVQAAMGVMMGAMGGVDIPEADRKGIYNHLAKHYADFDKNPPEYKTADEIVTEYAEGKDIEIEKDKEELEEKGAITDEISQEQKENMKYEKMKDFWGITSAFCDVYRDEDTAVEDFNKLLAEVIILFQQVIDGTFVSSNTDGERGLVAMNIGESGVDKILEALDVKETESEEVEINLDEESKKQISELDSDIKGLSEGIKTMDKENIDKFSSIEEKVELIRISIDNILSSQSKADEANEKGDLGRDPKLVDSHKKDKESEQDRNSRLALKVISKATEVLYKQMKDKK